MQANKNPSRSYGKEKKKESYGGGGLKERDSISDTEDTILLIMIASLFAGNK